MPKAWVDSIGEPFLEKVTLSKLKSGVYKVYYEAKGIAPVSAYKPYGDMVFTVRSGQEINDICVEGLMVKSPDVFFYSGKNYGEILIIDCAKMNDNNPKNCVWKKEEK